MTVAELQSRMDASEFAEWVAYAKIEPFGEIRNDQRFGVLAATMVNLYRKRSQTALTWRDFFPVYEQREPNTDWRDLLVKVETLNAALGGSDRRARPALDE